MKDCLGKLLQGINQKLPVEDQDDYKEGYLKYSSRELLKENCAQSQDEELKVDYVHSQDEELKVDYAHSQDEEH